MDFQFSGPSRNAASSSRQPSLRLFPGARRLLSFAVALSLLFAPLTPVAAQPPAAENNRILEGKILNDQGQPIPNATVKVRNLDTGEEFTSEPSGANGAYKLNKLPPGRYEIAVQTERGIFLGNRTADLVNKEAQSYSFSLKSLPADEALKEAEKARGGEDEDDRRAAGKRPPTSPSEAAKGSIWQNPLIATVLGLAIAIGAAVIIDEARDDGDDDASPSTP